MIVLNDACKVYISDIKTFFPVFGNEEKQYLSYLQRTVQEYVTENPDISIQELYDTFGYPSAIVSSYYESVDIDEIVCRINRRKMYRRFAFILFSILLVIFVFFAIKVTADYQIFLKTKDFFDTSTFGGKSL